MQRLVLSLERSINRNQEMRIKYPNDPEKFYESELELDLAIKGMHAIATSPHLYRDLIGLNTHNSICQLLNHDNTDIVSDVFALIYELTEAEDGLGEENPDTIYIQELVSEMVQIQLLGLLSLNIRRLDENSDEEKNGIYRALGIIENLIEIDPNYSTVLSTETKILKWILDRIQATGFDNIKQYSAEILTILLLNDRNIQIKLGELDGIEILLRCCSIYSKNNPSGGDEEEYLSNIFNALCITCVLEENKKYFNESEGLDLVRLFIKRQRYGRKEALRLLNYVLDSEPKNCKNWVTLGGIGTLFSAYMNRGSSKHKKGYSDDDEEHILSCIKHLLKGLEDIKEEKLWLRVVFKFGEKNFEKLERIVELFEKYYSKVKTCDDELDRWRVAMVEAGYVLDENDEDLCYLKRLDAGLFTLQTICYIIATICVNEKIMQQANQLLILNNFSLLVVANVLRDEKVSLGKANSEEITSKLSLKLQTLIDSLTN
eukprot:TRINITY_DN8364_c0_g1_i1.p1 TRINITY_DN8364_c0_g1~~TRINITY_DN8364_c0_g1_i1.p1  ORF type:complete len:539 (+),score=130.14 TRINITY_DN8364_c0_g1_i1:156-1619(+)